MKKIFFLLAFLLFSQAGFAWWSDGSNWSSRKPITINGSASALVDYQVQIPINWTSGMNSTFTDIRFTDNSTNGVSLPYWIENYTAGVNATVWIKTNLSAGINTIYLYFGNLAALSLSNARQVFVYAETGDVSINGSIPTNNAQLVNSGWTNLYFGTLWEYNSTNAYSSSLGFHQTASSQNQVSYNISSGNVNAFQGRFYDSGLDTISVGFNFRIIGADKTVYINTLCSASYYCHNFPTQTVTSVPRTVGWHIYSLRQQNGNNVGYIDNTQIFNISSATPFSNIMLLDSNWDLVGTNTPSIYFDNLFWYNRSFPEPIVLNVGAAETPPTISISLQSPANKTYNAATIDLNFTLSKNASFCIYELDGVNTTINGCQNTTINLNWYYQETANIETCSGSWTNYPCANTYDGNWDTYSTGYTFPSGTLTEYYIYPQNILKNNSLFSIKSQGVIRNNTLPQSCLNNNNLTILITAEGGVDRYVSADCYNITNNWIRFFYDGGAYNLYETAMWWSKNNTDGSHSVKVWANDSANNWGVSSTVSFTVDTTPPSATIQLPVNATYNKLNGSVTLNFTTSDNFGVSQCKYELDGVNTSLPTCANTTLSLTDGSHRIKVWVNDTANNWNSTPLVYFVSDFTEPNIQIQSPTNSTYTISTVALNFTISESIGLSTCKYELDGVNTTISCNANTTITGLSHGGHSIKIWANDTAGNMNVSATTSFSNDIILYVYVFDETTPTQNITFNLTISNTTSSRTINNNQYYIGNFTADPRGSLTLTISAAGYNPRTFYTTLDGTSKVNYTAYLLQGSNQYTFYIKNSNSIAISNAVVTLQKSINNVLQTVGQGTTDTAGTTVFTLTPNQIYSIQVTASNYNTYTGTILPTTASYSYTITMSSSTSTPNYKRTWTGISYSYQPSWTLLKNSLNTFNFTIYSTVDALTQYGMNISVNGTNLFSQTGNTSTGGSIQTTLDLSNYTTQAGYARLWFIKSGEALQYIQPDKNFNLYGTAKSNISVSSVLSNFGNSSGITEQTKFFIAVILSILSMATSAGFGFGRDGSAVIGLLIFGAFVWIGWVPVMYLVYGILFVFAISIIKRGVY